MSPIVSKYLEFYAEKILNIEGHWNSSVVIPAKRESANLPLLIESLTNASFDAQNLAIIIINGNTEDLESNQSSWDHLSSLGTVLDLSEDYRFVQREKLDLILINRFKDKYIFNLKEGVGHARKLGSDLALSLIAKNQMTSPWIRSTDADVIVPLNYFEDRHSNPYDISARIFSFNHSLTNDLILSEAIQSYDKFLHYYKQGLQFAGSPYANYTIGSTICVLAEAYAKVRGFPKRLAGEDFYLINKIAKIGNILEDKKIVVQIKGRLSDRTPFGTGQSLKSISENIKNREEYLVYAPSVFKEIKKLIDAFKASSTSSHFNDHFNSQNLGTALSAACERLQILPELKRLHGLNSTGSNRLRSFHTYFDGLKTLRLINGLRDIAYPPIPLESAIKGLESFNFRNPQSVVKHFHEYSSSNDRCHPSVHPQS